MFDIPRISFVKSLSCFLLLLLVSLRGASLRAAEPYQEKVLPFLKTYCVRCHNAKTSQRRTGPDAFHFRGEDRSRTSGSGNTSSRS